MTNKPETINAIADIIWMARRYADGRSTYAPSMFNRAYDVLVKEFGKEIEHFTANPDSTLTDNGKHFPYAKDRG